MAFSGETDASRLFLELDKFCKTSIFIAFLRGSA